MANINHLQNSLYTPDLYQRRYDLDLPADQSGWKDVAKRTAVTVLPFIGLYRPAGAVLSLGMGSVRFFSHLWGAKESENWKHCSIELIYGALAAISVASTLFSFPLGLAISTAFDVLQGAFNVYAYADDPRKLVEELLQTLSSVLYLGFMVSGGLEMMLISTLAQTAVSFFQAQGEISEGKYLEAAGKIAFGCIRLAQAKEIASEIQRRNEMLAAIHLIDSDEKTGESSTIHFADETGELKKEFTQSIANAKKSIVCMTFSFTDQQLINLLSKKRAEGVAITLVVDKEHMQLVSPYAFKFTLLTRTEGEGRLHHKITVIDDSTIWIGSANHSPSALTTQSNTMIRLESPQMAKALHEEMEVFAGLRKRNETPPSPFNVQGQNVELLLFPHIPVDVKNSPEQALNDYGRQKILNLIDQSKTNLKIAVCVWTDPDMAQAVVNAKKRGVDVEVILWKAIDSPNVYSQLKNAGVTIKETPNLTLMHNKWMLVDDSTFFNGSANWSKSWFTRNDESAVILNDLNTAQKAAIQDYWKGLSK